MHPYRRLTVWKKAHELALATFRVSTRIDARRFPSVAHQLRRTALPIPAVIAEGAARDRPEHFVHFLEVAISNTHAFEYCVLLAAELGAISPSDQAKLEARCDQVCRMLEALRATVRKRAMPRAGQLTNRRPRLMAEPGRAARAGVAKGAAAGAATAPTAGVV